MGRHALPDSMELVEEIKKLKAQGLKRKEICKILGISPSRFDQLWQQYIQRLEKQGEASTEDRVEEVEDGPNEKEVSFKGLDNGRIVSLEDLLKFCKIDTNVWEVDHFLVNKWEGYRKNLSKDLVWKEGVVTGFVKDLGGLFIAPLIQVKAWLVRIHPIAVEPTISFAKIQAMEYPVKDFGRGEQPLKMALIIPDTHISFSHLDGDVFQTHDSKAMNLVLQIAREYAIDHVVMLGDLLDFPEMTDKYRREPVYEQMTQPSLTAASQFLADVRYAVGKDCEFDFIRGNHDDRMLKMIIDHLPQAYHLKAPQLNCSLLSLENLLGLNDLNIKLSDKYPDGVAWINDYLRCVHDAGLSAAKTVDNSDVSTIFGHIHRVEQDSRTIYTRDGARAITAMSPGFLGKVDGSIPGQKKRQNWSQGFAVVYFNDTDSTIVNVPIRNGKCIFDNLLWQAE